jgi:superfamily II DNA or RNA helicase
MQESLFTNISRDERQEQGRVKWIKNKCRGTIVAATGFGKTRTALKCLRSVLNKYPELKVLVVVPTDNLKEQWLFQLDTWGLGLNSEVQIINTVIKRNWQADILVLDENLSRLNSSNCWNTLRAN